MRRTKSFIQFVGGAAAAGAMLLGAARLGLRQQPQPFPAYPQHTPELEYAPLPANLPPLVTRYYRAIAGEHIPRITSAIISARGSLRFSGITFPARLRFTHSAGQGYRHYIEATFFGYPLLKVNEHYLDGQARLELPVGVIENEPKVDMAANLALWGESIWLPPVLVTDPRVRWEAIDEATARLVIPFRTGEDVFTVTFDPQTGLIRQIEALRYREATDAAKIPWRMEPLAWDRFHGLLLPARAAVTWADEGRPWLVMAVEEVVYNVDVQAYIRAKGA